MFRGLGYSYCSSLTFSVLSYFYFIYLFFVFFFCFLSDPKEASRQSKFKHPVDIRSILNSYRHCFHLANVNKASVG